MKTSSKLTILLSALLMMSIITSVPLASAPSPSISVTTQASSQGVAAARFNPSETETGNPEPLGPAGSGWKADVQVSAETVNEVNPSIGTYIDSVTGAVTLYVAMQKWDATNSRWILRVSRSLNRGASWSWWYEGWWSNPSGRSIINPSIAVSPYNGTVFVAAQDTAIGAFSNDISVWHFDSTGWWHYNIDANADDDRSPHLVSEYSWGTGNYLHVSYEMYWTNDDRDLYHGRSTDWGQTWSTQVLRGGGGTPEAGDVFTQSDIAIAQNNFYIAYRHSTDYNTPGHIEVMYSTNYGGSFNGPFDASPTTKIDAWWPSITGSHAGPSHAPTTLWVAYENATGAPTWSDVFVSWSKDYGDTWSSPQVIAGTTNNENRPKLSVDGMGTESFNVPGKIHLAYWSSASTATRINAIYYTQISYYEPSYTPVPQIYYYYEGWSTPQGQIIDNNAWASGTYPVPTITTFTRTVGAETLWMPGVAWTDYRNPTYDIYFTTLDTMFSVTFFPSTQSVVAGGSLSYYVTVNLLSGATATATLDITGPHTYHMSSANVWGHTFSPPTVTPTGTSLLTFNTANYLSPGIYNIAVSAVIGGYRRMATLSFTVTAAPILTLNVNPSTVARGSPITLSGQLTPGIATTINIYYRFPHSTGSWALATTLPTNALGIYSVTATVPMGLTPGTYDLIAVWFNPTNGKYAASPIRVVTFT